ncbi:unnamed protein product, partial [Phaeothamnion confervicola]
MVPSLFCDLDGVLCDFDAAGCIRVTGRPPGAMHARQMWPRLARAPSFYGNLPWMRDGRQLWDNIRAHRPTILTGVPMGGWAPSQKAR